MRFKEWLMFKELVDPLGDAPVAPLDRRSDLIKGGEGGCPDLPMDMRSVCQPTTSAFPTYKAKMRKKLRK